MECNVVQLVACGIVSSGALSAHTQQAMLAIASQDGRAVIVAEGRVLRTTAAQTQAHGFDILVWLKLLSLVPVHGPEPLMAGILARQILQPVQITPKLLGLEFLHGPLSSALVSDSGEQLLQTKRAELAN